jgi:Mg2+/Co2+ transporter CorB
MTVAVLIFGEITPKFLAKVYPEKFAMGFYPLIKFFYYIFYPLNLIFGGWKWLLSKIFRFKDEDVVTEDEIITIVAPSNDRYPLFLARLIDLLSSVNYSFKECGLKLNLSSSQVEKLLRRDASLWQFIQSKRLNENH